MAISSTPEGRAQLAAQGIGDRMIKPEEAENFSRWLKGQGIYVSSEDLSGATAQMNVWTDRGGNIHMGFLATKHGRTVAEYDTRTRETGERTKYYDNLYQYYGGLLTQYSPVQQQTYSLIKGMLTGMGMDQASAEKYAVKAVASGYGSAREGLRFGRFFTSPSAIATATVIQGIDIAGKVITDPDYKKIGNPLSLMKNRIFGEVTPKLSKVPDNVMKAPIIGQYMDIGQKLGEAIRNNDVKTIAQMHGWSEKQARDYIDNVHSHWDDALEGRELRGFDFHDAMEVLYPPNQNLLDSTGDKMQLSGTISYKRPHGGK